MTLRPQPLRADQYRLLVESSPTLIWRAGLDAKCDYFNETWLAFTGRALHEEVGDGWVSGVHPDDKERCFSVYVANFEARTAFEMEYRLRRNDGVYRWLFDRGVPYQDESGSFAGFIGSCVDVHERRSIDEARATFLSMMSHELRTPLTPLRLYVDELERLSREGRAVEPTIVTRIGRQVKRIQALVEHVGDAARMDRNERVVVQRDPIDLAELLRDVVQTHVELLKSRRASSLLPSLALEGSSAPLSLEGDALRLEQVFDNVIANAIKYSPEGGKIVVKASKATTGELLVEISDEGIGIPALELPSIGRRFFRASNVPSSSYAGMGLGLALSKEIIAAHGGMLSVSPRERGVTVTIALPGAA